MFWRIEICLIYHFSGIHDLNPSKSHPQKTFWLTFIIVKSIDFFALKFLKMVSIFRMRFSKNRSVKKEMNSTVKNLPLDCSSRNKGGERHQFFSRVSRVWITQRDEIIFEVAFTFFICVRFTPNFFKFDYFKTVIWNHEFNSEIVIWHTV